MARVRLGVVLLVPPPFDREIDGLRRAAGDGALGRVPAHCTLVPPVNVRQDRLGEVLARLRAAAAATQRFSVELGPPATFLPDNPVLHLPVAPGAGSAALSSLRGRVFVEPLARPLTWPFVPHVTLADDMDPPRVAAALVALADYRVGVTFERVHLLAERPGRVWEPIADADFGPLAVIGRGGLELELARSERPDPEAAGLLGSDPVPPPTWAAGLASPPFTGGGPARGEGRFTVTARRDGAVVGAVEGIAGPGTTWLSRLVVEERHRRDGIGSHLLAAAESLAAERGDSVMATGVVPASGAHTFLRRRGWSEGKPPPDGTPLQLHRDL